MMTFLSFSLPSLSFFGILSCRGISSVIISPSAPSGRIGGGLHAIGDEGALVDGRQEAIAPQRRSDGGRHVGTEHDVAGQVLVLGAQPVSQPGTHGRAARLIGAGVHHQAGRLVIRDIGVDRADPADVVGDFAEVRPEFADVHAALPVLLELERRLHQFAGAAFGLDGAAGQRLAVVLLEHRLGIEAIDGGAAAVHEQEDDALDALRVIELGDADVAVGIEHCAGPGQRVTQHAGKRHHAEAVADPAQRFPARQRIGRLVSGHRRSS